MTAYELAEIVDKWAYSESAEYLTDAANMLRQQADRIAELEKEKDRLEKLVHQRFDDGKRLGILDTELKYKFAPQTKPLSDEEIWDIINSWEFRQDIAPTDNMFLFARAIEAKVWG